MHRTALVLLLVLAILAARPAWGTEIDGCHPTCGAPGDPVYVQGSFLADPPTVTLGDRRAEVIRSGANALICRVPEGLPEGTVALRVDGKLAAIAFQALAPGRPVVHGLSATIGTPGQAVFLHGRRLQTGRVSFLDARRRIAASSDLVGGARAGVFRVPVDLAPGTYTLVFVNGAGLDSGPCSHGFHVASAGQPELFAMRPIGTVPTRPAHPGQRIHLMGADLGPEGPCRVHWRGGNGLVTSTAGLSNGHDLVRTFIPVAAPAGLPMVLEVESHGGATAPAIQVTPGPHRKPILPRLDPSEGPPGSYVAIRGLGLPRCADALGIELSGPNGRARADLLCGHAGGVGHASAWYVRIPESVLEGKYEVRVRAGSRVSEPTSFRVTTTPLTVERAWPKLHVEKEPAHAVTLEGSGFGTPSDPGSLWVVWTDGERQFEGSILFRTNHRLRVLPPGEVGNALPVGTWAVFVILDGGDKLETAQAGTYAVLPAR